MRARDILPALISFGNIGCGIAAIVCAFGGSFEFAGWLIILATVLDVLDGRIARLVKSTSKFGSKLDSLADLVTFGIAPAVLVNRACTGISPVFVWGVSFFFAISAAIRLAKFCSESETRATYDETRKNTFTGLPSTSAGGAIASLIILNSYLHTSIETDMVLILLPIVTLAMAILMLSRLPYTHAKVFFTAKKHGTVPFILEVVSATTFFVLCPQVTVAAAFCFYAISGLLGLLKEKVFTHHPDTA